VPRQVAVAGQDSTAVKVRTRLRVKSRPGPEEQLLPVRAQDDRIAPLLPSRAIRARQGHGGGRAGPWRYALY
jgi:hypothetical protein